MNQKTDSCLIHCRVCIHLWILFQSQARRPIETLEETQTTYKQARVQPRLLPMFGSWLISTVEESIA